MLYKAYIRSDPHENPEVTESLYKRLTDQGIAPFFVEKEYREIIETKPFLYFRNSYLRLTQELDILKYHHDHPEIPYLIVDHEIISINPSAKGQNPFRINNKSVSLFQPSIKPLPILLGTHQRPIYLKLTLNSLLYSIRHFPEQKIYIVLSQPDEETRLIVQDLVKNNPKVEAVISDDNLKYAFANFGSKFYSLEKFIHHEDDGIIPQNLEYFIPFWTQQLHYRHSTAPLVTFRISESNWTTAFHKSDFLARSEKIQIPDKTLWYCMKPALKTIVPMGGMGMVIDSRASYRDFKPPSYNSSDHDIYYQSSAVCLANIPIYHIGANYEVDYPAYALKKSNTTVNPIQKGTDLRSGVVKTVDLTVDWEKH